MHSIEFSSLELLREKFENALEISENTQGILFLKNVATLLLARAFTIPLKLGFIRPFWKVAVLCMLIKPDNPPSQTTSYQPISLLSAIMKLFERVIEKRLRKHLEDNGFFSKCQSGFKGELQRENKFVSYERAFKMLEKDKYIVGIGQAVLELLSFKAGSGNHHRGIKIFRTSSVMRVSFH